MRGNRNITMTFLHPILIPFLCIPIIIAFAEWFRKGQTIVLPFDHTARRRGFPLKLAVFIANCLPPSLLAAALLLLAGPIRTAPPETERLITNIQLCLDVSRSMSFPLEENGMPYGRFNAAMQAINDFTSHREGDAFGLTVFSEDYLHWVPLTQDLAAIRLSVPFVRPWFPTWGGTAIANALDGCIDVLSTKEMGDRMIILLTDGVSSDIRSGREATVVQRLKEANVAVFAVSLVDGLPTEGLVNITKSTRGALFTAVDQDALRQVFKRIDEMQKTKIIPKTPYMVDHFQPFALAGLALLAAHFLAAFGLRYTPW
jgi:Ca-activated chloride channel homolog